MQLCRYMQRWTSESCEKHLRSFGQLTKHSGVLGDTTFDMHCFLEQQGFREGIISVEVLLYALVRCRYTSTG